MKNKISKFLLVAMMSTVLVGCGGGNDVVESFDLSEEITEDTTITFFGWGSKEEQDNFQALSNAFMAEEPHVKVVYSACDSSSYMNTLKNRANSLPDVFYMPDYDFMEWADSGKLLAIDDYITQDELDSMWAMSTQMYRYDSETYSLSKGKLYGLPKDLGPYTLVYNKDLLKQCLEKNGKWVDEATSYPSGQDPMSWAQFNSYLSNANTHGKDGVYPIGYYELMAAVYSNNADFWDPTIREERISSKNFIDAVQFIADLTKNGLAPTANEQSEQNSFQRFVTGKCIFTFMGPWDMATFWKDVNFDFDIIPVPYGPAEGAKSTAWVGSVAYCINAKSQHKKAAVKFAKFLACSEKSSEMNYMLGQAVPNLKSWAENQFVRGTGYTEAQAKAPANRQLFVDIIKGTDKVQGKQRAKYFLYDATCYADLESSLEPVYTFQKSAEDFLKAYAKIFQDGLDDSNDNLD